MRTAADGAVLLTGGNPQIAKGFGDAPVAAYFAALPGWKGDAGRRVDALIVAGVPGVAKAVKWNSPLYGVAEGSWFLGLHATTRYLKVAFFRGARLLPPPPVASRSGDTRYLHIGDGDFDAVQFVDWVRQAAALPGERM